MIHSPVSIALVTNEFESLAYQPIDQIGEAWVTSPVGEQVDSLINAPFVFVFGHDLIGANSFDTANMAATQSPLENMLNQASDDLTGRALIGNGGNAGAPG